MANLSLAENLSPELNQYIQLGVEHGYDQFLNIVSQGRQLDKPQADNIAQGQVWLGQEALKHHLVDELGDFDTAVNVALKLVNERRADGESEFDSLPVQWFVEDQQDFVTRLLNRGQATIQSAVLNTFGLAPQQVKPVKNQLGLLNRLNDPKGQYIYCLDCSVTY